MEVPLTYIQLLKLDQFLDKLYSDVNNLYKLSLDLAKIINYYNPEDQKVKIYNNEISEEEYQMKKKDKPP